MQTNNIVDLIYVYFLLTSNAVAFLVICLCYTDMYVQVRQNKTANAIGRNDKSIAKKMAILVFTDFVCLFPIALFGLTAASGLPLITVSQSKILLVFFFPLNACCNPFLYVIFTKQFRKDLLTVLGRCGFCERRLSQLRITGTSAPHSGSNGYNSRNSLPGGLPNCKQTALSQSTNYHRVLASVHRKVSAPDTTSQTTLSSARNSSTPMFLLEVQKSLLEEKQSAKSCVHAAESKV